VAVLVALIRETTGFVAGQGRPAPVHGDRGEQPVLDPVPLAIAELAHDAGHHRVAVDRQVAADLVAGHGRDGVEFIAEPGIAVCQAGYQEVGHAQVARAD
jgi:hypothetical protein